jgi:hypothetical protein
MAQSTRGWSTRDVGWDQLWDQTEYLGPTWDRPDEQLEAVPVDIGEREPRDTVDVAELTPGD